MNHAMRKRGMLVATGFILASPLLHAEGGHHWSYSGESGPAQWAALESDYSSCGVGKLQSPIDIHDRVARKADMVAHLVHKNTDGNLAVVAVLLKTGPSNKLIETLWKNLPKDKEKESAVEGVQVNAADLLPGKKAAYYTFTGSLTTPPCSEGVTWFVLKAPTSVSNAEVMRFAQIYPMNARPTQPVNGREIRATA